MNNLFSKILCLIGAHHWRYESQGERSCLECSCTEVNTRPGTGKWIRIKR